LRTASRLDRGHPFAAAPFAPRGHIATLAVTRDAAWTATTPELAFDPAPNGTCDLLAALLLGHLLTGLATEQALERWVGGLFGVLEAAARRRLREMPLAAAQDVFVKPPVEVVLERLGD
jgi:pyridoxine kinase